MRLFVFIATFYLLAVGNAFGSPERSTSEGERVDPSHWPAVRSAVALDPAIEKRVEKLLARMTLEQKVGQIIQADSENVTPEEVRRYRLGSVLSGGDSAPGEKPYATGPEWLAAADAFYRASMETDGEGLVIPVMLGIDAVHGHNNVIGATAFPHNIGLGAARNPDLIRRIHAITAREVAVTGLDWVFAPTLAVVRDDRWGRTYESYSESPDLVRRYAGAAVLGLQGSVEQGSYMESGRVIATAKHFLGDGGTVVGRDQGDNRSDEAELRDIHAAGYFTALEAGAQTVMASFSSWHGVKLHGHEALLTDVLKRRLGFDGFVVGDWNGHGQVAGCSNTNCPRSFNAGVDMFMAPDSWKGLYETTLEQVRTGRISRARLDDAVARILRVKLRAGLFEKGPPSQRPYAGKFELLGAPEHRAVARQAVRESLVLLKNADGILPLDPDITVLVAGDGADNIPKQSGGWTLSWQGTGLTNDDFPRGQSIFAGIQETVTRAGGRAVLSVDGRYSRRPDAAVVVFGEDPYAEFQGDKDNLAYSPADRSDAGLLRRLQADGIPVISVFLTGRPLWVNPEINASNAFVVAWLPGTEGGGVSDVLFRSPDGSINHDFRGRLSFSWPETAVQPPQNPGEPDYDPLFPFGYGLTYADNGALPALPEDSGLEHSPVRSNNVYFIKGRVVEPWRLSIQEKGAGKQSITSVAGTGPEGLIRFETSNRDQQGDTRTFTWLGADTAVVQITAEKPIDLTRETNGNMALAVDLRVDKPPQAKVMLGLACGAACEGNLDITKPLHNIRVGEWRTLSFSLSCFRQAGADMSRVYSPFILRTSAAFKASVSDIRLISANQDIMDCPIGD